MATLPTGMAPIWHLTVDQYHSMIETGILVSGDPVELLEGILVQKASKSPLHVFVTRMTRQALDSMAPAAWFISSHHPITLAGSEPKPDTVMIRGDMRDYSARHPGPAEVGLIAEVADATLERDRFLKKRIYATAGIPFYWLLDLVNCKLEVYSEPKSGDYQQCAVYGPEDSVPVTLDGRAVGTVSVRSLLP
jgi:hypothetical protein